MSRRLAVASAFLALLTAPPCLAAVGGPDSFGYTWSDAGSGCSTSVSVCGAGATTFLATTAMQGPFSLGFTMPYFGQPVSQIWVSPYGYVTFSPGQANVATPGSFPTAASPNNMIAAHWASCMNADICVEATPGQFHVRWIQRLNAIANQEAHLYLAADGSWRMSWRGAFVVPRSVGYENANGTVGTTLYYDPDTAVAGDEIVAPGYSQPSSSQATCVAPPVLLSCATPVVVQCGDSAATTLPAADPSPASIYSCSSNVYQGNERVAQVVVAAAQQVSVSIDNPALTLLQIGSNRCAENNCLAEGTTRLDYPILFPGTYTFAVDKLAAGGGDAFNFRADCFDPYQALDCGGSASGDTSGGSGVFTTYSCTSQSLDGPEALYRLTLPVQQNLAVTLATAEPDLWVVLYDRASFEAQGNCLSAGRHGAGVFDAPPGDYVIVVDGANAAAGAFTISATCGPQLDCSAAQTISCSSRVTGDTSGSPSRVSVYNCSSEALTGGEDVYTFLNPVEQTIDARFISSTPGQRVLLLPTCGEGDCLLIGAGGVSCALFPPGSYYLIVDGTSSGPYDLQINCSEVYLGIDLRVASIDARPLAGDCSTFAVNGNARVGVANLGDTDAPAGFDIVVFEDGMPLNGSYDPGSDNLLGSATFPSVLPRGQTVYVDVPSTGTVAFRDNVIYAAVDTTNAVAEVLENNNTWDTGRACEYRPPVGVFNPTVEWYWNSSTVEPTYVHVDTIPLIGDVDGNTVPDVIVNTGAVARGFGDGIVRALDGRSGAEIWSATGADARVYASTNLALADITGDTLPETIGLSNVTGQFDRLVAIDNTGLRLWTSDALVRHPARMNGGGAPLIADLDCNGRPEVVYGANVFNELGQLVNAPPDPVGTLGVNGAGQDGSIAIAIDIDLDGTLEIVGGPTAYRYDPAGTTMSIIWQTPGIPDGYPAAGNFDDDPYPEIAITGDGTVYMLDGDTGALKWTRQIPRGGGGCNVGQVAGGPPTIADFDGDCAPEVGVAGADLYSVLETDGSVRWSAPINDCSSHRTASTVFDFDGDGAAEVAYQDQDWLHVFRGSDGSEITRMPGDSHTWTEMVSIADVDADNNAEIVLPLNPLNNRLNGVQVIGDADDNWVNTRRIWNQHQYHINNVNDDSSVPGPLTNGSCEQPSYRLHNTYRDQLGTAIYTAPDITISLTSYVIELVNAGGTCFRQVRISARVGNGGGISVGQPFTAWFWKDDGAGGRLNLVSQVIPDLQPGEYSDFEVVVQDPGAGSVDITAVADDDGAGNGLVNECREDNNTCVTTVYNDGLAIDPPEPLGPALRVDKAGDPNAPSVTATLHWELDQALPRPADEHYHLYTSRNNRGSSLTLQSFPPHPHYGLSYDDATPRATNAELPNVHYYLVVPADECEQEPAP